MGRESGARTQQVASGNFGAKPIGRRQRQSRAKGNGELSGSRRGHTNSVIDHERRQKGGFLRLQSAEFAVVSRVRLPHCTNATCLQTALNLHHLWKWRAMVITVFGTALFLSLAIVVRRSTTTKRKRAPTRVKYRMFATTPTQCLDARNSDELRRKLRAGLKMRPLGKQTPSLTSSKGQMRATETMARCSCHSGPSAAAAASR